MSKRPSLTAALSEAANPIKTSPPSTGPTHKTGARAASAAPHRVGRVNVTGYFAPAVRQSIRLIQSKCPERTTQDLLAEALNDLFAKYNVPQTAHLSADPN